MENKTHYRKVFKSDHLGIADLEEFLEEGKKLIYTIREVKQHTLIQGNKNSGVVVAGKRISANIAYFKEQVKPLVLNSTNSKVVKSFNKSSPFVEDWANTVIELYIDNSVKMKGELVGGVRIRPVQPILTKPHMNPDHPKWEYTKQAVSEGRLEVVKTVYDFTEENLKLIQE